MAGFCRLEYFVDCRTRRVRGRQGYLQMSLALKHPKSKLDGHEQFCSRTVRVRQWQRSYQSESNMRTAQ